MASITTSSPSPPGRRIAYLTCKSVETPGEYHDCDAPERAVLTAEAVRRGYTLEPLVWDDVKRHGDDDTLPPPGHYAAAIVRSCWNYHTQPDAFLEYLRRLTASGVRVLNNPDVIRWNADKRYLGELAGAPPGATVWPLDSEATADSPADGADDGAADVDSSADSAAGVAVLPTVYAPRATEQAVAAAFTVLDADELVIKPAVGAGSWRQARVTRDAPLPPSDALPLGPCLMQAFHAPVVSDGELTLVFYSGEFAYGVHKVPAPGEYRSQPNYGAQHLPYTPTARELTQARAVLARATTVLQRRQRGDAVGGGGSGVQRDSGRATDGAVDGANARSVKRDSGRATDGILYARIDFARAGGADREALVLMELELIEPHLYLPYDGSGGERGAALFFDALERQLA